MFSSNATQVSAVTQAEAVDFDGTNDYLLANSLTGATDSKTFTLSAWIWPSTSAEVPVYAAGRNNLGTVNFYVYVTNSQELTILAYANGSTTQILNVNLPASAFAKNTFNHLLISFDMASTSNRRIYINDVAVSPTYSVYTDTPLLFSTNTYRNAVGTEWIFNTANSKANGRLSNVFLDYTYRDLSITANRRLFVTADLKPAAGQAALSPILYLPMSDPTTVGTNTGTGGNFTLNGTIARSGRGPNQYNAPYSDLNGSTQYLSRTTAPTGIADSSTFTIAFSFTPDTTTAGQRMVVFASSTSARFDVVFSTTGLSVSARNTGSLILSTDTTGVTFVVGRNYSVVVSVDLTDTAKRHIYINGQAVSATWSTYTSGSINFNISTTPRYYIGTGASTTNWYNGKIGALWFNTSYIDLSQPANLAKFVTGTGIDAKPVDLGATGELPTGTAPIMYLPMYGNNAGKNYGTGGDFTVNSGPYTGARGPNEYWGNKMRTTVSSYVGRTSAMTGVANGKKFSCSFFVSQGQAAGGRVLSLVGNTGDNTEYLMIDIDVDGNFSIYGYNSSQVNILALPNMPFGGTATLANVYHVLIAVDLSTSSYQIYVNNVNKSPSGGIVLTNDNIKFDGGRPSVGAGPVASGNAGDKSEFYFTTEYIDFSQDANRLKFRDAFGNPVDLSAQITAAAIPTPAIYMRFPPTSFGTNSGTGGDFTVNGTITDGGQL